MRKVIIFQHVAHKILGTLNPTLKEHKLNIRYINFERTPDESPTLQKYHSLIVLGGHMGVYQAEKYQHIKTELRLIEEALKKDIPILGICLGAQLIANVLGAKVRKHIEKEIGWYDVQFTPDGQKDKLFNHFNSSEKLFQMHGDTFDIPSGAIKLASSKTCESQAFRFGEKVYGLQFHLEVDEPMIHRWLSYENNIKDMHEYNFSTDLIKEETLKFAPRSTELSFKTFGNFVELFANKPKQIALGTDHSKPLKKNKLQKVQPL